MNRVMTNSLVIDAIIGTAFAIGAAVLIVIGTFAFLTTTF